MPDHPVGSACRGRPRRGTTSRRRGRRRARRPSRGVSYRHVGRTYCRQADTCRGFSARRAATRRAVVGARRRRPPTPILLAVLFTECRRRADTFTLNKLECSKQAQIWRAGLAAVPSKGPEYWSHGIMEQDLGPAHLRPSRARETALRGVSVRGPPGRGRQSPARSSGRFSGPEVMINRDGRGHSYRDVRGEILGSSRDELTRKHLPSTFSYDQERKLEVRRRSDTALVLTVNDAS